MELPAHFEELMNRSPISQADITSFLREMRRAPSGPLVTSKLLAGKIQSSSEAQAIQAFDVLEAALDSETEGSIEFRTEIGRYRFLNEIIRILSPKYLGNSTVPAVKERAVQFLDDAAGSKRKRWFPSEHSKIQPVYQSLIDGGVIKKSSKFPSTQADEEAELQKSIFDRAENAAILKKLLSSKDPSDLQAANRLIKNLVEEESKRIERRAELHSLIDRIETSTSLLIEMLSQRRIDKEIVDELADTCRSLRQKLGGVATETNDETTSLLQASENLEKALELYEERKDFKGEEGSGDATPEAGATGGVGNPIQQLSLADELLMGLDLHNIPEDFLKSESKSLQLLSTLSSGKDCGDNLLNLDIDLSGKIPHSMSSPTNISDSKDKGALALDEIGRLSRELMEQSLMGKSSSISTPEFKKTDKTPLSQIKTLSTEVTSPSDLHASISTKTHTQTVDLFDFGFLESACNGASSGSNTTSPTESNKIIHMNENVLLVLNDNANIGSPIASMSSSNSKVGTKTSYSSPRNINNSCSEDSKLLLNSTKEVDLDKVDLIENVEPLTLDLGESSKDVNLTLAFGSCIDFPDTVKVAVVTLTNKSSSAPLLNYVFQLLPPKGLQIKLLPPGAMELPPWKKSFLPPPMLTQVALMVIPKGFSDSIITSQPKMRYILSFTSNDDTALHNGDFEIPTCLLG